MLQFEALGAVLGVVDETSGLPHLLGDKSGIPCIILVEGVAELGVSRVIQCDNLLFDFLVTVDDALAPFEFISCIFIFLPSSQYNKSISVADNPFSHFLDIN